MAEKTMKFSIRYGTHLPVLLRALELTDGPVLELGAGIFSTPVLHWICTRDKRQLVSMDNDPRFYNWAGRFANEYHRLVLVDDWDKVNIGYPWDVVLVDHSPGERRVVEIRRLAFYAKYIIIHDSNGRWNKAYHYDTIYSLFTSLYTFDKVEPSTTVLSNRIDVGEMMKGYYE